MLPIRTRFASRVKPRSSGARRCGKSGSVDGLMRVTRLASWDRALMVAGWCPLRRVRGLNRGRSRRALTQRHCRVPARRARAPNPSSESSRYARNAGGAKPGRRFPSAPGAATAHASRTLGRTHPRACLGRQLQRAKGGLQRDHARRIPLRALPHHAARRDGVALHAPRRALAARAARRPAGVAQVGFGRPPVARRPGELRHPLVDGVFELGDPGVRPRVHLAHPALAWHRAPRARPVARCVARGVGRAAVPLRQTGRRELAGEPGRPDLD